VTVLRGAAATDVGRVRTGNEDRYLAGESLFAVADGVGGHQAGEVAAQTAIEQLEKSFTSRTTEGLVDAVHEANAAVWNLAQQHAEKRGMGTTLTALALVNDGDEEQLALCNVGDSRGYLFQRGDLMQVTEDHSLVEELVREGQLTHEEAQVHPQRSIITRALGMEREIDVDAWTLTPYAGDRILLCSDGLSNEVGADRIAAILRQLADPQDAARELVRQARANGGNDNITVVVVDIVDDGGKAEEASAALAADTADAADADGEEAAGASLERSRPPTAGGEPPRRGPAGGATATAVRTRPPDAAAPPGGRARPPRAPRARRFTWRVALFLALILGVLVVVAATVTWYGRGAYFVKADGEALSIYKGRPGGFLWFQPTKVKDQVLPLSQVPAASIQAVREGKVTGSLAAADRYVNNLRDQTTTTVPTPPTTAPPTTAPPTTAAAKTPPP